MTIIYKDEKDNKSEHGGVVNKNVVIETEAKGNKKNYDKSLDPSQQKELDKVTAGLFVVHDHTSEQGDYNELSNTEYNNVEQNNQQIQNPSQNDLSYIGNASLGYDFGIGVSKTTSSGKGGGGCVYL